jgi:hypothetical protein
VRIRKPYRVAIDSSFLKRPLAINPIVLPGSLVAVAMQRPHDDGRHSHMPADNAHALARQRNKAMACRVTRSENLAEQASDLAPAANA